jgi:hypothetical protein
VVQCRRQEFVSASYTAPPEAALRPVALEGSPKLHREWHSNLVLPVNHSVRTLSLWMSRLTQWQAVAARLHAAVPPQASDTSTTNVLATRSARGVGSSEASSRRAGRHGGLMLGLSLGPKGGASHCAECKCEFLRIVRGRRHCRACLRSVCRVSGLLALSVWVRSCSRDSVMIPHCRAAARSLKPQTRFA